MLQRVRREVRHRLEASRFQKRIGDGDGNGPAPRRERIGCRADASLFFADLLHTRIGVSSDLCAPTLLWRRPRTGPIRSTIPTLAQQLCPRPRLRRRDLPTSLVSRLSPRQRGPPAAAVGFLHISCTSRRAIPFPPRSLLASHPDFLRWRRTGPAIPRPPAPIQESPN